MNRTDIESTLQAIESSFDADPAADVAGTGFWKAVGALKSDPELIEEFADRVAAIDQEAFRRWALLIMPLGIGTVVALIGVGIGALFVALAFGAETPADGIFLLLGMFVLFTALHSLAHLVVGRVLGIRFTSWFVGTIKRPQPGVKIDYSSYLRTAPTRRAWMHAAGAIMSKAVPFLLIPIAIAAEVPAWTIGVLIGFGLMTITTDALLSVKSGDWKKFKRELAYSKHSFPEGEGGSRR